MEDLVSKIIEIEHDAQEYLKSAQKETEQIESSVEEKTKKLEQDITDRARARCEKIKQEKDLEADNRIKKIMDKTDSQLKELEHKFEANKQEWINTVFESIIKEGMI